MSHLGVAHDASADFNGDGRSDILRVDIRSGVPLLFQWLGQPDGSFAWNAAAHVEAPNNDASIVGMADFNGDGRDDLLWAQGTTLRQWLGQADGSFVENPGVVYETHLSSGSTSLNPYEQWLIAGFGDFNGDYRDDILWRDAAGSVSEWLAKPDGSFAWNPAAMYDTPSGWVVGDIGDFNDDGRDDVPWFDAFGVQGQWLGQADGTFAYNPDAISPAVGGYVGDFNGDGRDDILHYQVYTVSVWLTQPSGRLADSPASTYEIPHDWWLRDMGDFNGDGRDDLLWQDQYGVTGQWVAQPDGSFDWNRDAIYEPAFWMGT
jgi:hypothetical protein